MADGDASKSACNACGTKSGDICCFGDDGSMKAGPCGTDGSFCASGNNYCQMGDGTFNSPCGKAGDKCAIDNLSCQDDGSGALKCLCVADYKPCDKAGDKMCDPGASPPSGKNQGTCKDDSQWKGSCQPGDYACFDPSKPQGQIPCNKDNSVFDKDPSCNKYCQAPTS